MDSRYPLALLLLTLIPLVFFIRRLRPTLRLRVSNLYLWHETTPANTPAVMRFLRRHWLVLLQATCLGAIAVAASGARLDNESARVAVILDTSVSMGTVQNGETRFDVARAQVRSLLDRLPGGTRVFLIPADPDPRVIGEFRASDADLARAVSSLRVTDAAAQLYRAIDYARSARVGASRLYVFSDVFSDVARAESISDPDVEWFSVGVPAENAAISDISWRRSMNRPHEIEVLVTVLNQGVSALNADLTLTTGVNPAGRQRVSVDPHAAAKYSFLLTDPALTITAHLGGDDAVASDNSRSLVVPPAANVRVLLIGEGGYFLEKALSAHPNVTVVSSESADHDLVICTGCREVPAGTADVLMFTPPAPGADSFALVRTSVEHPVTDDVDLDGTRAVVAGSGTLDGVVIAVAGGSPAIVADDSGARRILEIRLDSDNGPFPLSTAFPLLIANAIGWLSHRGDNRTILTAGEPLQWNVGVQRQTPVVVAPDNREVPSRFANGILSVADTRVAGLYRIRLDSGDQTIAVNPAVRIDSESGDGPATPRAAGGRIAAATAIRTDLTVALALASLLLLAVEWRCGQAGTRVM